jgi:hypothetical protein
MHNSLSINNWVPGISPGVKVAGAFDWRPTTLVVPNVKKIRGLNLPGTPMATSACRGRPLLFKCIRGRCIAVLIVEVTVLNTSTAALKIFVVFLSTSG